jgi:hypothetical protein
MRILTFARRRPLLSAVLIVIASILLFPAAAGVYLALHPNVGGWTPGWQGRPNSSPPLGGGGSYSAANRTFVMTESGPRLRDLKGQPPGIPLGTVDFLLSYRRDGGFPRPTTVTWALSVNSIRPAPAGPLAGDRHAWEQTVAEALAHTSWTFHPPIPAAGRFRQSSTVTTHDPWAFVLNVRDRLWHAPRWFAVGLLTGMLVGAAAGIGVWMLRRRAGPAACPQCGYDCTGISRVCPECGAPITAPTA